MPSGVYVRTESHREAMRLGFVGRPSHPSFWKGKKLSENHRGKMSESRMGNKYRLGIKCSEEEKKQLSVAHMGHPVSEETRKKISQSHKGKILSPEHYQAILKASSGPASHWWKGGISSLDKIVRSSKEYKRWRTLVFGRDNYTCQNCGVRGTELNVDHIKPFAVIRDQFKIKTLGDALLCEELWDVSNGRTLCKNCHEKTDTYGSKTLIFLKKEGENVRNIGVVS